MGFLKRNTLVMDFEEWGKGTRAERIGLRRQDRRPADPSPDRQYRLVDAATGEFERDYVKVADMVTRQPWDDNVRVHVDRNDHADT